MPDLKRHGKRVFIGFVGGLVALIGFVLIPYPGPGWLIVFAGFAILSTEFLFAQKALDWLHKKYDQWAAWVKKQPMYLRVLIVAFTGLVVLVTAWLLNTFGLVNWLLDLKQPWLVSPLGR